MELFAIAYDLYVRSQTCEPKHQAFYEHLEIEYANLGYDQLRKNLMRFNENRHSFTVPNAIATYFDSYVSSFDICYKVLSSSKDHVFEDSALEYIRILILHIAGGTETPYRIENIDLALLKQYWLFQALNVFDKTYSTNEKLEQMKTISKFSTLSEKYLLCIEVLSDYEISLNESNRFNLNEFKLI